jgi:hypothetical protein
METATQEDAASSVIVFIKDTPRIRENFHFPHHSGYRSAKDMLEIAECGDFICGIETECGISTFHDTAL